MDAACYLALRDEIKRSGSKNDSDAPGCSSRGVRRGRAGPLALQKPDVRAGLEMQPMGESQPPPLELGASRPLVTPLYQSAVYTLPDLDALDRIMTGDEPGFIYARDAHPNARLLAAPGRPGIG